MRRIGLAQHVVFERQDAVVVRAAAEQHGPRRHQRAFRLLDQFHVAGTARLARHAVVRRIDEADVLRRFLVQQRVAGLGIGRAGVVPGLGIFGQDVGAVADLGVLGGLSCDTGRQARRRVAAMAIDAAQLHRRGGVHALGIGIGVARYAALAGPGHVGVRQTELGVRRVDVGAGHRLFGICSVQG